MSSLLDKFFSWLPEGLSTKYSTAKLQTRLQNHYGDTIVIESQKGQGQSNIVFSSSISVADAIRAVSKMKYHVFITSVYYYYYYYLVSIYLYQHLGICMHILIVIT